jgi:hypothetical protein
MAKIQLTLEQKRGIIDYALNQSVKGIFEDKLELWPGLEDNDDLYPAYRTAVASFMSDIRKSALELLRQPAVDPATSPIVKEQS